MSQDAGRETTAMSSMSVGQRPTERSSMFSDAVEPYHHRIDAEAWDDIYVIGDVHGCFTELEALIELIDPSTDDLLIFVGDLVRKGPNSRGVIERVRDAPNMLSIRGNNEEKLLTGEKTLPELDDDHLRYLRSLPLVISWGENIVVHGGIVPEQPLTEHTPTELLTTRATPDGDGYDGPFWFERYDRSPQVFFGHTVLEAPVDTDGVVGLDTGCVYGGYLTAYDTARDRFLRIEARETYRDRSEDSIVDPEAL